MQPWLAAAKAAGTISCQEHNSLLEYARLVDGLIQVDDFAPDAAHQAHSGGVRRLDDASAGESRAA